MKHTISFNYKISFLIIFIEIPFTYSQYHYSPNETYMRELFSNYQDYFEKTYKTNSESKDAYQHFVNNLKHMAEMNQQLADKNETKHFVVNIHTDVDPVSFANRYGVELNPFDLVELNILRQGNEDDDDERMSVQDVSLFNVLESEDLYENYLKKFKKQKPKTEWLRQARFLRFIKTLVEINRNSVNGITEKKLDDKADIIRQPGQFFF